MNYVKKIFAPVALSVCTLLACAAANAATLNVHNDTDMPMALLYISPTWSGYFRDEDEQLGNRYIPPHESARIDFAGGGTCLFDLRAVFVDETQIEHRDANLCAYTDWHISEPQ